MQTEPITTPIDEQPDRAEYSELMGKSTQRADSGVYLELNSLLVEYKNLFDRSNKLDNKVYITITFCGFLFMFITGLFSGMAGMHRPTTTGGWLLAGLYVTVCVAVMVYYVSMLIYFMRLLRPEGIIRMDPDVLKAAMLNKMPEPEAAEKLIELYRRAIGEDLVKLKTRCNGFTRGIRFVIGNVILAFCAYALELLVNVLI